MKKTTNKIIALLCLLPITLTCMASKQKAQLPHKPFERYRDKKQQNYALLQHNKIEAERTEQRSLEKIIAAYQKSPLRKCCSFLVYLALHKNENIFASNKNSLPTEATKRHIKKALQNSDLLSLDTCNVIICRQGEANTIFHIKNINFFVNTIRKSSFDIRPLINAINWNGRTPLSQQLFCTKWQTPAEQKQLVAVVRYLIKNGADPHLPVIAGSLQPTKNILECAEQFLPATFKDKDLVKNILISLRTPDRFENQKRVSALQAIFCPDVLSHLWNFFDTDFVWKIGRKEKLKN